MRFAALCITKWPTQQGVPALVARGWVSKIQNIVKISNRAYNFAQPGRVLIAQTYIK